MKPRQRAYVGIGGAERHGRAEFYRERGLAVTALDYYVRRDGAKGRQRLVPVRVVEEEKEGGSGFTLALGNGRRVEMRADFDEDGLERS